MRSVRAAGPALGAVLATACSLLTNLDGLTGGSGARGSDDGSPAPDAPGSDATQTGDAPNPDDGSPDGFAVDASAPDATHLPDGQGEDAPERPDGPAESGPIGDASIDARDASPPPFCASLSPQPLLCADFDEGSAATGWSYVHMTSGTIALDTTEFRSPPAAMIAQSGIAGSGAVDVAGYGSFALMGRSTFTGTLDLDFRVDRADATGGLAVLAQIGLLDGTGGGQYFVQFVMSSNGAAPLDCSVNEIYFATGTMSVPVRHPVTPTIAIGAWTHLTLSIVAPFGGGSGTQTIAFDGVQVGTSSITVPVRRFSETVGVGLTFVQTPSNGWTTVFDDVTFNATAN
jgi:hypothetical protein